MRYAYLLLATCLLFSATVPLLGSDKALTNDDVIALLKADLGETVVIAKIKQATATAFDLTPEALIKLKKNGVPQAVLTAMLDRESRPQAANTSDVNANTNWTVRIVAASNSYDLTKMQGTVDNSFLRLGTTTYHNFPGAKAKIRVHESNPVILVATPNQPNGQYFVVKPDSNARKQLRSVKVGHGFYGMADSNSPDPDWTVPYEATEDSKGIWRLKLTRSLVPGEYGVYVANNNLLGAGEMYDFGVE